MKREDIKKAINELVSLGEKYRGKYNRNLRLYEYTRNINIDDIKDGSTVGYYYRGYEETSSDVQQNIIKSCVDTLVSKIASQKVRPFFNTVHGSFRDFQICKQAQQYFDLLYDMQNVGQTVDMSFRDCCIFSKGVVYCDEIEKKIKRAMPFNVYTRPSEETYGKLTRVYYKQKNYPVSLLQENIKKKIKTDLEYVDVGLYYDIVNHVKAYYIPQASDEENLIVEEYKRDTLPFVFIHYSNPVVGSDATSIVDLLYGIQIEIDTILQKITEASRLNPAMTFFLPEGSQIKAGQLNNRVGNIITYRPTPNMTSSPVTTSTPAFIDDQYIQLLDNLKTTAYELTGISKLSAQSAKPVGIDSGLGLRTITNIESERFQTQFNQVIRMYVEIARTCISVFDPNDDILPRDQKRVNIKWSDIVEEYEKMSIQYSGADALSKDPATKLQQLQVLAQAGVISQTRIAQLMEIPDLESGYSMANNSINAVMTVIDDCIMKNKMDVPEYIPIPLLKEELVNTMLSLRASDHPSNALDIAKLTQLYQNVCDKETQSADTLAEMNGEEQAKQEMATGNDLSALGSGGAVELATPQIENTEGE
jgi:hypothetical protein